MAIYGFADVTLDSERRALTRAGQDVAIEPQVFDLLVYLASSGGRVVSKEEIFGAVWDGRIVSDEALTSRIKAARRAIGDDGKAQRLIRTVHRVGYQFLGGKPAGPVPEVRFTQDGQGRRIAYSVTGSGPVVLCPAWWVSNVVKDLENPDVAHFFDLLGAGLTVVRYDRLGVGLSDRSVLAPGLEEEVDVLDRVANAVGAARYGLFGMSMGGPVAIRHTRRLADRLTRLCLYGTFAQGAEICPPAVQDVMVDTVRAHWGLGSRVLAQTFLPDATAEAVAASARQQRACASAEVAADLLRMAYSLDVADDLAHIRTETMVIHRKQERCIPTRAATRLAAEIPGARLLLLEGSSHLPWDGDAAVAERANAFFRRPEVASATS